MRAGTSTLSITPALDAGAPVWLAGFDALRPAAGVLDELTVRALVLEDGPRRLGLVSVDLIGLFAEEVQAIRAAVAATGLRLDHLVISCTHTHSGPDSLGVWSPDGRDASPPWLGTVRERTVQALHEAARRMGEVHLKVGTTTTPGLIRDTLWPEIIDEELVALRLVGKEGRVVATLVNWGNHAEVLGPDHQQLSADFPGVMCRELERDGGMALFLPRAIGGLMTPLGVKITDPVTGTAAPECSVRKMELLGQEVARAARRALATGTGESAGRLSIQRREVRVPLTNRLLAEQLNRRVRRTVLEDPDLGPCLLTEVSHVALGPLDLVMVPGEMYPELLIGGVQPAADPADEWDEPPLASLVQGPLFLVGLANDELGYVIPPSQWRTGQGSKTAAPVVYTPGKQFARCLFEALRAMLRPTVQRRALPASAPGIHVG